MTIFEKMILSIRWCTCDEELEIVTESIVDHIETPTNEPLHPWQCEALVDEILLVKNRIATNNSEYLH